MLHARPRTSLRRCLLPALLLSSCTAAFAGLVTLTPIVAEPSRNVLAYTAVQPIPSTAPVARERTAARASRTRQLADLAAVQEEKARLEAEAKAKAAAEAKAKAEAEAKAKAAAEAEAAAAAAKAKQDAAAAAERAKAPKTSSSLRVGSGGACPVPNASFSDTWGAARSGGRAHKGTDLMAPHGSPAYAVVSGVVRTASSSAGGISLYLAGDNGETYFYAHNSSNVASSGQRVSAGDLVARVGSSGNASSGAPHVHFEREVGGRSVNPYDFVRRLCG